METEHTPPTAARIVQLELAKVAGCFLANPQGDERASIECEHGVCRCGKEAAAAVAALRSEGLLRPDTPSAALGRGSITNGSNIVVLESNADRTLVGDVWLGGLAVGSELSDEQLIERLTERDGMRPLIHCVANVTHGADGSAIRPQVSSATTLHEALLAAASAPKGEPERVGWNAAGFDYNTDGD